MKLSPVVASAATQSSDLPWHTEGLFSAHYLTHRLPDPKSSLWPSEGETETVFAAARQLLHSKADGLKKGNEEDCEREFISPLLKLLGFGYNNRKALPNTPGLMLPDYLLYVSPSLAETAFHQGTRAAYYADCLGLLEAKRWGTNLSQEPTGKTKAKARSPHQQIRDYLSESERLSWGILTNGAQWRLYCKRDRASSYFEIDLAQILTAEATPEARGQFRLFYALFRRAAWERGPDGQAVLDAIRLGSQQFKEEVERRLRVQVFDGVEILARGFLANPDNELSDDDLPAVYQNCLILLYRILFVLNAEARDLLPTRPLDERSKKYYHSYGLERVRLRLATAEGAAEYEDDGTFQLYQRFRDLFTLINGKPGPAGKPDKNEELNIPRYNGGLFDPARAPFLEAKRVADRSLSQVLRRLSYRTDAGELVAFDYANLGERHLGSIYEGLLEHRLARQPDARITLTNDKGERKTSGAYYTPEAWVAYIVRHTLTPLLERLDAQLGTAADLPPGDQFAEAVLQLNVCDPAMGSGHFLVEATAFLAEHVAGHPSTAPRPQMNTDGTPQLDDAGDPVCTQEAKLAYWKRRLVEACIYGVDLNPLAVELAKLSLWLETVDRVPLNFLDHHLRCGNSLLGTPLTALSQPPQLKPSKKKAAGQLSLAYSGDLADAVAQAIQDIHAIESVSTDTHDAAKRKEALWREVSETLMPRFRAVADLWLAPWFGSPLEFADFYRMFESAEKTESLWQERRETLAPLRPFHWELEFPDIFFDDRGTKKAEPGFDAVIGNPPWERIKLQENEFFSGRSPAIALAPKASDRKKLIAALPQTDPGLWAEYQAASDRAERMLAFTHRTGFFPLMGRGDTNLYAVFAEKALQLVHPRGRVGLLVPSGIATDDTTKAYFQELVEKRRLAELLDFENRQKVFEDVDGRFKFSIILMTGESAPQSETRCGFFLHALSDLNDPQRVFTLSPEDFQKFNPNTLTCPIFRRRRDAELTRKIYDNVPVLVEAAKGAAGNPWGVSFLRMFDMTNDSALFKTMAGLDADGFYQDAADTGQVYTKGKTKYLPLYEGKMVQMYDHRAAGILVNPANLHRPAQEEPTGLAQHCDPGYSPTPQFWVDRQRVVSSVARVPPGLMAAYVKRDEEMLRRAVMFWLAGWHLNKGTADVGVQVISKMFPGSEGYSAGWSGFLAGLEGLKAQAEEEKYPLLDEDRETIVEFAKRDDLLGMAETLIDAKCPRWLLGFKSVTAPTNARSFICSVLPLSGVGNSMPVIRLSADRTASAACLIANFSSYVMDFSARQKIGGQNLNFFIVEQFPVLPPERYAETWHGVTLSDFITRRVLELCYTAHDLQGFAADLGYTGKPFAWDEERRLHLRCQLDALYFHLYGLTREEAVEILETFPIVRRQDEAKYGGKFRTRDLIVAYYNAYAGGSMEAFVKG